MGTGDIRYVITVDSTGAVKSVQDFDKTIENLEKQTRKTTTASSSFGNEFTSKLIPAFTAASLAADVVKNAIGGVKEFLASSVNEALESESAIRRLNTAMELTGRASAGASKDLLDFAQGQARVTAYTDEEIIATETMLAQLTKLDRDGIKNTTKGIMGLAAVLGPNEGLEGATMRVVRALEGNAQGLSRVGIEIDTTLPKGEQLIQIQEKLAELYPRATAELETTAGALRKTQQEWRELKEEVGRFILKLLDVPKELEQVRMTLQHLQGNYGALGDKIDYAWAKSEQLRAVTAGVRDENVALRGVLAELQGAYRNVGITQEGFLSAFRQGPAAFDKWLGQVRLANQLYGEFHKKTEGAKSGVVALLKSYKDGYDAEKEQNKMLDRLVNQYGEVELAAIDVAEAVEKIFPPSADEDGRRLASTLDLLGVKMGEADVKVTESEKIWDNAIGTMMADMIQFGDGTGSVLGAIGSNFTKMAETVISAVEMETLKIISSNNEQIASYKKTSLAAYIASIFQKIPFPFSLIAAGAAFAAINALFAKVMKFEQGGVFTRPTIAEIGHGTEYVLPEKKLIHIVQMAQAAGTAQAGGTSQTSQTSAGRTSSGSQVAAVLLDGKRVGSALVPILSQESRRGRGSTSRRTLVRSDK